MTNDEIIKFVVNPEHALLYNEFLRAMDAARLDEKGKCDNFAISFAAWCMFDPDAKAIQAAGATAYQMLERYKDRPFIDYTQNHNQ